MSSASYAHFHNGNGNSRDGLGVRVTRLEIKVDHIQKDVSDIKGSLKSLDDKVERKFSEADAKFEKKISEIVVKFDDNFEKVDQQFNKIDAVLCRLVTETAWTRYGVFAIAGTGMATVLKLFWHSIV